MKGKEYNAVVQNINRKYLYIRFLFTFIKRELYIKCDNLGSRFSYCRAQPRLIRKCSRRTLPQPSSKVVFIIIPLLNESQVITLLTTQCQTNSYQTTLQEISLLLTIKIEPTDSDHILLFLLLRVRLFSY